MNSSTGPERPESHDEVGIQSNTACSCCTGTSCLEGGQDLTGSSSNVKKTFLSGLTQFQILMNIFFIKNEACRCVTLEKGKMHNCINLIV